MKRSRIMRYILLYLLVFFLSLSFFSTNWALDTFEFLSFDEIIFQLTSPVMNAESSILMSYFTDGFLVAFVVSLVLMTLLILFFNYISCKSIRFELGFYKKRFGFSIKTKIIKIVFWVLFSIFSIFLIYNCLDRISFIDFLEIRSQESSFIEDNYVYPEKTNITFPEKKKNLIYIFVESLESTYFSKDLGGGSNYNYLEPLTELTYDNINFSDGEKFGGATSVAATTWTSAGMVAQTSGLPLKVSNTFNIDVNVSNMLDNAYALGNILEEEGYNQMLMLGSQQSFGNRGVYFTKHGNYEIFDYDTAIEKGKISDDYNVWWGFEDSKLFQYAKEEISRLAKEEKPFNFTMLTANTHFPDGYLDVNCPKKFNLAYGNSLYCSALQIEDFINWAQEQDFYDDTTIVVVGDHISMQTDLYDEKTNRKVYNLFINSSVSEGNFKNRSFTTMDMFPTTLSSLGVEIEGNRLGLGTNLFSDLPTLLEKSGFKTFNTEIAKYSSFYNKEFLLKKKK